MIIELIAATAEQRPTLENLMQLYIHDFSEHWSGRSEGDIGENGRFADYPLDAYWREANHVPLLLRVSGTLAGFALLNDVSHVGQRVDHNMAEFFVARKYRRTGIGKGAAHQIFTRFPGQWETSVARRNAAALAFWRKVIMQHSLVSEIAETDVSTPAWNGPVIRFRARHPN